ncbi:MAG: polyprenyl synthetase family protein, partial [Thermoleophilaceae bacterium]
MEATLTELLPAQQVIPNRLHDAMRYSTLGGGKRVRAMLVFAAGEVSGAPAERLRIPAAAVEMIHAYSLIHDDLPCMDDDVLRRGKPTCHVEFDEATALLAGDALQSLAFQVLADYTLAPKPESQLKMLQLFAIACGSRGMAGGQAIDLDSVGKSLTLPELEHMHILKTGALIRASVLMGSYCGAELPAAEFAQLDRYGKCIGLAFQVVDDILDEEGDAETLGKTAGKDRARGKPT